MDLIYNNDPNVINDELIRVCIQVRGRGWTKEDHCTSRASDLRYRTANARNDATLRDGIVRCGPCG